MRSSMPIEPRAQQASTSTGAVQRYDNAAGWGHSWFMSAGLSRKVANELAAKVRHETQRRVGLVVEVVTSEVTNRLAAKIRHETQRPVEVHEDEGGFVVRVVTREGISYIHSPGQWEWMRSSITVSDDAPTEASDPGLARQTRQTMERGARSAVRELRSRGVVRAISFLGYYLEPVVWLVTEHDAERDQLLADDRLQDRVLLHLSRAGVRGDLIARGGVTAESEETVNRDFGGCWYHAMK